MDYAGRHPGPADVALVGEVSETTLDRDQGEKCAAYARGGVPVYWIINLIDNRFQVYTDPNPAYGYRTRVDYQPGDHVPIVIGASGVRQDLCSRLALGPRRRARRSETKLSKFT